MANNFDKSVDLVVETCLAVQLRMVNRVVTNVYDEALRPLGLRASQMNILVAAYKMRIARPAAICARLHLDVSTLSRNVERMKNNGWLEVVPDSDGRAQPIRVTDAGRKLLEQAIPLWKQAQDRAMKLLGDGAVDQLAKSVERLNRPCITV
jgi:DNA-binding MarR family transcriptional regulator